MGWWLLWLTVNNLAFLRLTVNFWNFYGNGYFFPLWLTGLVKN